VEKYEELFMMEVRGLKLNDCGDCTYTDDGYLFANFWLDYSKLPPKEPLGDTLNKLNGYDEFTDDTFKEYKIRFCLLPAQCLIGNERAQFIMVLRRKDETIPTIRR
jgi:hypothetical protein